MWCHSPSGIVALPVMGWFRPVAFEPGGRFLEVRGDLAAGIDPEEVVDVLVAAFRLRPTLGDHRVRERLRGAVQIREFPCSQSVRPQRA